MRCERFHPGAWLVLLLLAVAMTRPAGAATNIVTMTGGVDLRFIPPSITINVGDTVVWNDPELSLTHSITGAGPEALCGNEIVNTCSKTFTVPGSYVYFCGPHIDNNMTGVVHVVSAPAPPALLTNALRTTGGQLKFTVLGAANRTNIVQASTDLSSATNWAPVASVVPAAGEFDFTETNSAAGPIRFYRVVNP